MRLAFFSSLILRSSTARSSLQGLVALSALVVLTGAKGQGCGSADVPTTTPEPDCGPGFHWETVCSPCEIGEMCEEQCVPDKVCSPGWIQQTFCGGSSTSVTTSAGQGGMDGDVAMPMPPEECWTECVPPQPFCPPGTIEQIACSGGITTTTATVGSGGWTGSSVGVGGAGGMDAGAAMPMPPGECWTECVPVEPHCLPGTKPQTVCGGTTVAVSSSVGVGGSGGYAGSGDAGAWEGTGGTGGVAVPPPPPGCWTECVPVEPYCPPGTKVQTVCGGTTVAVSSSVGVGGSGGDAGSGAGGSGGAGAWAGTGGSGGVTTPPNPGDCRTECVPVEPYCPPGTQAQEICYDGIPETTVSAGTGYGSGGAWGGCFIECVPVEPYCPPDTIPQTVCEDSVPGTNGSTGTGYGGGASPYPGGGCRTECIPVEPYCPPGTLEQKICSGAGSTGAGMDDAAYPGECWTECVEGSICPPEAIKRTICEEPADGGSPPVCRTECVLMLP
ncbi:hypothetical protein [Sorangium sp. So ce385]|uniref:hypothetical protein n=1 Tax=Sorangium sp. So ce385 TaxID=3133308 RepID=UPI003F5BA6EC